MDGVCVREKKELRSEIENQTKAKFSRDRGEADLPSK